jgi:hypothetical protein
MPTGCTYSDEQLRWRAVEAIVSGRLPLAITTRLKASFGIGSTCCLCGQEITRSHAEYEVVDVRDGRSLVLHVRCHQAWQLECIHRHAPPPPTA